MAFMMKDELRRLRLEKMRVVRILDDVDWVYGSKSRVKRHERSEWAQKSISEGRVLPKGELSAPRWLSKRSEALPKGGRATLLFSLCEYPQEEVLSPDYYSRESFKEILSDFSKRQNGVAFSELVKDYINKKFGGNQARAAKAAQLDPQVVNQIYNARHGRRRGVSRNTVIALGLAFELKLKQAEELMQSAGYAFSDSDEDILLKLCFRRQFYKISLINEVLRDLQVGELGSKTRREYLANMQS